MGITQLNFEGKNKVEVVRLRLREYEPREGYWLAFSGGKDSVAIYHLAQSAGVKFDAHYCVSPIDPPEIYQFIKEEYPEVAWDNFAKNFWETFLTEGPPLRQQRWCCELIKEAGGKGRRKLTGIRWAESNTRRGRLMYEPCYTQKNTDFLHPIIDWSDSEVWEYINLCNIKTCSLYQEGFKRIGCVLCPYESPQTTLQNIKRYPKIAGNWRRAIERYFYKRIERGTPLTQQSPEELWEWWIGRK